MVYLYRKSVAMSSKKVYSNNRTSVTLSVYLYLNVKGNSWEVAGNVGFWKKCKSLIASSLSPSLSSLLSFSLSFFFFLFLLSPTVPVYQNVSLFIKYRKKPTPHRRKDDPTLENESRFACIITVQNRLHRNAPVYVREW